jgi:hypothetical protein
LQKKQKPHYLGLQDQESEMTPTTYLEDFLASPLSKLTTKPSWKRDPEKCMQYIDFLSLALVDEHQPLRFEAASLFCQIFPRSVKAETLSSLLQVLEEILDEGGKEEKWSATKGLCRLGRLDYRVLDIICDVMGDMDTVKADEALELLCAIEQPHKTLVMKTVESQASNPNWKVRHRLILFMERVMERGMQHDDRNSESQSRPLTATTTSSNHDPKSKPDTPVTTSATETTGTVKGSNSRTSKLLYLSGVEDDVYVDGCLELLYQWMWNDWNEQVREQAAKTISTLKQGASIFKWITSQLTHELPAKRIDALKTFEWLGMITEEVVPAFVACFTDNYKSVVLEACKVRNTTNKQFELKHNFVKVACILKTNHSKIIRVLLTKFDDTDWRIRCYTVKGIDASKVHLMKRVTMWI